MTPLAPMHAALLGDPDFAPVFADWLKENGCWNWEAILGLVLVYPDSDGPRLLAALWLEEHGEMERGEFVRVQCELTGTPPEPPPCDHPREYRRRLLPVPGCPWCQWVMRYSDRELHLGRRERELLSANFWRWFPAPLNSRPAGVALDNLVLHWAGDMYAVLRRGFVEALTLSAADWLAHADALTAAQPVREVTLTDWPGFAARIDHECKEVVAWLPGRRQRDVIPMREVDDLRENSRILAFQQGRVRRLLAAEWPNIHFTLPPTVIKTPLANSPAGVHIDPLSMG